jgi:hypothetical protein
VVREAVAVHNIATPTSKYPHRFTGPERTRRRMSEISKIGRAMETITPVVTSMSTEKSYTPSSLRELQEILRKLQGYRATCDHALLKLDEKDPVTQVPRYGPNMVQKIQTLDVNLKTFLELTDTLIEENISALEEAKKSSPQHAEDANLEPEVPGNVEEKKDILEEVEPPSVDLELLNAQAEEIRQKKRKQQLLERSQQELEIHTFIASVDTLNRFWFRRNPDRSQILNALRSLKAETSSPDHFMKISTFVADLLEKVSRRPDDEKLRRIRINHPFIQVSLLLAPVPSTHPCPRLSSETPGSTLWPSCCQSGFLESQFSLQESPSLRSHPWRPLPSPFPHRKHRGA